jgi:hypothetical protein
LDKIGGDPSKLRPWLQDFSYPVEGYAPYGPEQVRAQIDAAEAEDVEGWLLWNGGSGTNNADALNPE